MRKYANFMLFKFLSIICYLILHNSCSFAQLQDWRYELPITITNNSSSQLSNYQTLMILNTRVLISAGYLKPDGADMRFTTGCGTGLIQYCLEDFVNTDTTRVWVTIASLAPYYSTTIYMFMGNPSATSASNLSLFEGPYSSTNYVSVSQSSTVSNCQRGFRFSPNRNILVTHFGKRVPNSTPRYVTLFDFNSQQILSQLLVSGGSPGSYNYNALSKPLWLLAGHQYVIQVYSGTGDNYYFGVSSQIGPYLIYRDMRYANNCTQNTFPTSSFPNLHYGTPDFLYYVRQTPVDPEPIAVTGLVADTNTPAPPANLFAAGSNHQASLVWRKNTEFDIAKYYIYMNTSNNRNTAQLIGNTYHPDTNYTVTNLENGTAYYFWVRAADRYCIERVSDFSNVAVITPLNITESQKIPRHFALYQNFPNPFNPSTDIKFDVPKESFVNLSVYDLLGREAAVLVNQVLKAGAYTVRWVPTNIPSGVYIYKLTASEYEKTIKMVMLK